MSRKGLFPNFIWITNYTIFGCSPSLQPLGGIAPLRSSSCDNSGGNLLASPGRSQVSIFVFDIKFSCMKGGDIELFITIVPKVLKITFSYSLAEQPWGLLLNLDCLVGLVECPNVSTTNCNLQIIYRKLSYPFRFLVLMCRD